MRFDTHICLISKQATPNLVPVLAEDIRPKEVVMLVTPEMADAADTLATVLVRHQIKVTRLPVADAYDMNAIQNNLLDELIKREGQSVALNATGGTKTMAMAAQAAFQTADFPVFYFRPENNQMLFLDRNAEPQVLSPRLTLSDYLGAHGYAVIGHQSQLTANTAELTDTLAKNVGSFADAIGQLNRLANEAERKNSLEIDDKGNANFERLVDWFIDAGLMIRKGKLLVFRDENARFYANGGWLEEHVFRILRHIGKVQDKAMSLEVVHGEAPSPKLSTKMQNERKRGRNNEIDVAVLANNRLYLIECKTRNFEKSDGKLGADALYKLDSLTALGGLNTQGMLISYRPLDDASKNRAKDLRIKTIEAHQLPGLENQLREWLSK